MPAEGEAMEAIQKGPGLEPAMSLPRTSMATAVFRGVEEVSSNAVGGATTLGSDRRRLEAGTSCLANPGPLQRRERAGEPPAPRA